MQRQAHKSRGSRFDEEAEPTWRAMGDMRYTAQEMREYGAKAAWGAAREGRQRPQHGASDTTRCVQASRVIPHDMGLTRGMEGLVRPRWCITPRPPPPPRASGESSVGQRGGSLWRLSAAQSTPCRFVFLESNPNGGKSRA